MQFTYTPEGSEDEPQVWDFEPGKLLNPEAEAIEKHTGMTFGEWQQKVLNGSVTALHGLLYVLLKREIPTLRYDQVKFRVDEVTFEFTDEEKRAIIKALDEARADGPLDDQQLALYDQLAEDLPPEPEPDPADEPEPEDKVVDLSAGDGVYDGIDGPKEAEAESDQAPSPGLAS